MASFERAKDAVIRLTFQRQALEVSLADLAAFSKKKLAAVSSSPPDEPSMNEVTEGEEEEGSMEMSATEQYCQPCGSKDYDSEASADSEHSHTIVKESTNTSSIEREGAVDDNQLIVAHLQAYLRKRLGMDHVRLVLQGKQLSADLSLQDVLPKLDRHKLVVIASNALPAIIPQERIKDDTRASKPNRSKRVKTSKRLTTEKGFGFGSIEVLPGLKSQDKAYSILESLATDPGIQAVMDLHRWYVPVLKELYPEGYVGVSEVCVLGLNENHGARISLRIRTDDLKGFRKYLTVKKVLYHELAHNIHGDHNDEFYLLMRQIEKEANAMDWTMSRGHKIGGDDAAVYRDDDNESGDDGLVNGGVHKLGGDSEAVQSFLPPDVLAREAALLRMHQFEQQHLQEKSQEPNNIADILQQESESNSSSVGMATVSNEVKEIKEDEYPQEEVAAVNHFNEQTVAASESHLSETELKLDVSQSQEGHQYAWLLGKREEVLAQLDESLSIMSFDPSLSATQERLAKLRDVLETIFNNLLQRHSLSQSDFEAFQKAVTLLQKIVSNAKTAEPKYRRLKTTSTAWQKISTSLGLSPTGESLAEALLLIAGFQKKSTAEEGEVLVYERKDQITLILTQDFLGMLLV